MRALNKVYIFGVIHWMVNLQITLLGEIVHRLRWLLITLSDTGSKLCLSVFICCGTFLVSYF